MLALLPWQSNPGGHYLILLITRPEKNVLTIKTKLNNLGGASFVYKYRESRVDADKCPQKHFLIAEPILSALIVLTPFATNK